jgi:exosortase
MRIAGARLLDSNGEDRKAKNSQLSGQQRCWTMWYCRGTGALAMQVRPRILLPTFGTRRLNSPVETNRTPPPANGVSGFGSANQTYVFAASVLTSLLVFWAPLHRVLHFAGNSEFSYIPLIPAISGFLILSRRHSIFREAKPSPLLGSVVVGIGVSASILVIVFQNLITPERLSLQMFGIVIIWWGLFIFCYGLQAAQKAMLPLGLLLFVIPPPELAAGAVVAFLQHASAILSYQLFRMIGVPALRDGMVISLPQLTIEVAPECSGIRSSMSLLIVTLAAADLYLGYRLNRILLALLVVPLCILKNGIRIVTLSTLALYVDPSFLTGPLHHQGGILFFLLACMILAGIVVVMGRCESTG